MTLQVQFRKQVPRKIGRKGGKPPGFLFDDFADRESRTNRVDLDLHVVARFGLWNEDYETLNPSYSVSTTASLFDVKFVFLTFLNRLVEGTLKAHTFHLVQFVQLVPREKT